MVKLEEWEEKFLRAGRVLRLATFMGKEMHNIPLCYAYDGHRFYIATDPPSKKIRNIKKNPHVTWVVDDYSEDWNRLVGIMLTGTAEVIEKGSEFAKCKKILDAKFHQYETYPIKEGTSAIIRLTPKTKASWDHTR